MAEKFVGEIALTELVTYIKKKIVPLDPSWDLGKDIDKANSSTLTGVLQRYSNVLIQCGVHAYQISNVDFMYSGSSISGVTSFDIVSGNIVYHYRYATTQQFMCTKYEINSATMMTASDVSKNFNT